ncbi:MAG: L,D-transpeptidase family protein [Hyphomicrobiaceae bacterium]|nr:L,D-transpeptidase family protein [Hyphomicrobiaceae bacterium]
MVHTSRVFILSLAALVATAASLAIGPTPADAKRQRTTPPAPTLIPWIGPETEQQLQRAIDRYSQIAARGGWPTLPDRTTLRPGDSGTNVAILRKRLRITGDLSRGGEGDGYDEALTDAVKRYQARNGLEPNGIVYGITQRLLNVPVETRIRQLQTNLQRIRDIAPSLVATPKYILMNAASFELQGTHNGRVEIVSRTIAGKRTTPTPSVSTAVRAINILPYWHVPGTIAQAQLVPAIRKDPSYLYRENIRVFSTFGGAEVDPAQVNWWGPESARYVFRQDPGPNNALGVLRFDMPNKHIVYMHDTPMKQLFGYFERAYSAGCVRIQDFYDLAEWILAGQDGWTTDRLRSAVESRQPTTIKLAQPVPVHFIYLTAWIDNGVVQFRNDLYNRDERSLEVGDSGEAKFLTNVLTP